MTLTDAERERLANMRDACQAAIDGKPWEVQNTVGEWRSPEPGSGLPMTYWRARAKPWSLPPPPEGRRWHRTDFTAEMLPPVTDGGLPWRPLLRGEHINAGDEQETERAGVEWYCFSSNLGPCGERLRMRTRRPLPSAPVVRPWTPEEMFGKTVQTKGGTYKTQITTVNGTFAVLSGLGNYSGDDLLSGFTQLDGAPCGTVAQTPDPRA